MSFYFQKGSPDTDLSKHDLKQGLFEALDQLGARKKVLAIPPDYTRFHSFAGQLTNLVWKYYGTHLTDILPALGTHSPMTDNQINHMFGKVPKKLFRIHDWRRDVVILGNVPAEFIRSVCENRVDFSWPAQVNKLLVHGRYDLILSIGQVVPHEVSGMANYNKNIFVGTGGAEGINKSHFLGAVYGLERIMGKAINPVRTVLNYANDHFARDLPVVYVLTVVGKNDEDKIAVKGLFIGDNIECFIQAADLSLKVNFQVLEQPLQKIVVYLDPSEYKSTWLGNKSIYRTRMAIADGGELVVIAPGLNEFGEDKQIDKLIRKYGYLTTPEILQLTQKNIDLQKNLGAAAHLIHGSSENRFKITYCPGHLTREEIEHVNFNFADIDKIVNRYDPKRLTDGFNKMPDGEEIFYISNPALGLWASKGRMGKSKNKNA